MSSIESVVFEGRPPMLLRRVPARTLAHAELLAGRRASPEDTWWELVDPAAPENQVPAAVAVTRTEGTEAVRVQLLSTGPVQNEPLLAQLLSELLAALRRTETTWVHMAVEDANALDYLQAYGFMPQPAQQQGERDLLLLL